MIGEGEGTGIGSHSCLAPVKLILCSGVGYLIVGDRFG